MTELPLENKSDDRSAAAYANKRGRKAILSIAIFKILQGLLLFIAGACAAALINKDAAAEAAHWAAILQADPNNKFIHAILIKIGSFDHEKLEKISAGTFCYSALLLTEAGGLFLRKLWAEYMTVIVTGSLIPLEIYELIKQLSAPKILILVLNLALVLYLIFRLARRRANAGISSVE